MYSTPRTYTLNWMFPEGRHVICRERERECVCTVGSYWEDAVCDSTLCTDVLCTCLTANNCHGNRGIGLGWEFK